MADIPKSMPERIANANMRNVTCEAGWRWRRSGGVVAPSVTTNFSVLTVRAPSFANFCSGFWRRMTFVLYSAGISVGYRSSTLLCQKEPIPFGMGIFRATDNRNNARTTL